MSVHNTISSRTAIKLPISLIAACVVGIAIAWWSQFEAHKQYDNERFADLYKYVNKKADDRYTASEARQFAKSIEQRFKDEQRANNSEHRSIQRQLDHLEKEINRISK